MSAVSTGMARQIGRRLQQGYPLLKEGPDPPGPQVGVRPALREAGESGTASGWLL